MTSHTGTTRAATIQALRIRLGVLFASIMFLIVALLGAGLFVLLSHLNAQAFDRSLDEATAAVIADATARPIDDRAAESLGASDQATAREYRSLRIPGRQLWLIRAPSTEQPSSTGEALTAAENTEAGSPASTWMLAAADRAFRDSSVRDKHEVMATGANKLEGEEVESSQRLVAVRFSLASGGTAVAVAVATHRELENQFGTLIFAFAAAAMLAVVLAATGGWLMMRRAVAPAEQAVEQLERFTADAAHELRTPLAVLRTRAEVALREPRTEEHYRATLDHMLDEVTLAGLVVDDLLLLARADAGGGVAVEKRVSLDDQVASAAERIRPIAREKGVHLSVSEFEESRVDGDPVLLERLVLILLDNAVRCTDADGRITVSVVTSSTGGARLTITDNGHGIASTQLNRIFDRFYRGDAPHGPRSTSDASRDGAGLGLSIARWICAQHGARISVASTPAVGSTFTVDFPAPSNRAA